MLIRWLGVIGLLLSVLGVPAQAIGDEPPRTRVVEWRPNLDRIFDPTAAPETLRSDEPLEAVGVLWSGSLPDLQLRYEAAGGWSDWREVDATDGWSARTGEGASALASVYGARAIQLRAERQPRITPPRTLRIVGIDSASPPAVTDILQAAQVRPPPSPVPTRPVPGGLPTPTRPPASPAPATQTGAPRIFTRAEWGADPQYMTWPASRVPVRKFAIHHTASSDGGSDPAASIRAIYYYHAVTLGWGDIGYNYIVDRAGNIYEGRAGGVNTVGAHVENANEGVDGISLLGTYQDVRPSDAMIASVVSLIAWRARGQGIDPQGSSSIVGRTLPNILAHRDLMSTDCPGDLAYALLPTIRQQVAYALGVRPPTATVRVMSARLSPTTVGAGGEVNVELTIANAGTDALTSQGPDPGTTYTDTDSFRTLGQPEQVGRVRMAVDIEGAGDPDHRYRWGIGGDLAPGGTRTVQGTIRFDRPGSYSLALGIVQEGVSWMQDGLARTTVTVYPAAAASYRATSVPATELHFPLVMLRQHGWTTRLHLTNTTDRAGIGSLTTLDSTGRALARTPLFFAPRGSTRQTVDLGDSDSATVAAAVVTADVPLAGVAFHEQSDGDWMAVEPVVNGSPRLNIPLAARNYHGLTSGVQVQNLGETPTTISITYLAGTGATWTDSTRVAPMGFVTFYAPGHRTLPDGFVGSAIVESEDRQPLAAQVNLVDADGAAMAYPADDAPSAEAVAPLLFRNRNGWRSGLQIQNTAGTTANVIARYVPSNRTGGPWEREGDVSGALGATFYLPADPQLPDDLVVSADVRATGGQPLALLANSVNDRLHVGTAVGGLTETSSVITVPLLTNGVEARRTGVQVQNFVAQAAPVVVSIYDDRGTRVMQFDDSIPARGAKTFYAPAITGLAAGSTGSLVVVGRADARLAAVVNEVR